MTYYRIQEADTTCKRCPMSSGCSVFGQSEVPLGSVSLIVVSAYPGKEEVKQNVSLAAATDDTFNAGKFFRYSIASVFDSDERIPPSMKPFVKRIFITNAVKCSPKSDVKQTYIDKCRDWLDIEIGKMPEGVPILIAASEAVKSLLGKGESLYANRRVVHQIGSHPAVVTFNPIEPLRYSLELEKGKDSKSKIPNFWKPIPYGEMRWHYLNDLKLVKDLVVDYIGNRNV